MNEDKFENKPKEWLEGFNSNFEDRNPYGNPDIPGPKGITQQFEDWQEGKDECWQVLETALGQIIYENEFGCTLDDHKTLHGQDKKQWSDLEPWNHDDYEWQSSRVIQFLTRLNLINTDRLRSLIKESLNEK